MSALQVLIIVVISACVPRSDHPFLEEGQTNSAEVLEYLNEVLQADPDNNNALYQKAQLQADQQNWNAALITIDKALKIDFTNNDYFFLRGKIMAELGDYTESIEAFKRAEILGNNSHELYKLLSRSYLALKQPSESRKVVNRLLKLDDGDEAHILAGETLLALNDSVQALQQFKEALTINATNEKALTGTKKIYYGRGELARAELIVDQLITLDSTRNTFLVEKADLLEKRGVLDSAKILVKSVLQSDSSGRIVVELAELEYQMGHYDSVLYYLQKHDNPENLEVMLLSARAFDKMRDFDASANLYKQMLEIDSTNNIARSELTVLKGKMAYLQRIARERARLDSARNNPPPVLNRREIVN